MLVILIGKQLSGKTSVAGELVTRGYEPVLEYTTRPKREGETDGVQYRFVSEEEYQKLDLASDVTFPMTDGVRHWGIAKTDLQTSGNRVLVTNPKTLRKLWQLDECKKDCRIICLYVPQTVRLKRWHIRGDKETEFFRRKAADNADFRDAFYHHKVENTGSVSETADEIQELLNGPEPELKMY